MQVSGLRGSAKMRMGCGLRLDDFSGGNTARADISALDRALEVDLDPLQVREEPAQRFADDLGAGATGAFDLPAPLIFVARDRAFLADKTFFWHRISIS